MCVCVYVLIYIQYTWKITIGDFSASAAFATGTMQLVGWQSGCLKLNVVGTVKACGC